MHEVISEISIQFLIYFGFNYIIFLENCRSVYDGRLFRDENFILRHTGPGCLSMASRGPDTNGSLFLVTFSRAQKLDESCVVFGCLANQESYDTLMKINEFGTATGEPLEEVRVVDCGVAFE